MGVLQDIQQRDDNLYRVILQSDPVSPPQAGYGGTNRYEELMDLADAKLVVNTTQKLDVLSKRLYINRNLSMTWWICARIMMKC